VRAGARRHGGRAQGRVAHGGEVRPWWGPALTRTRRDEVRRARSAGPVDEAATAARGVEALQRQSDGVEARWVGRWTDVERRSTMETRGNLASISPMRYIGQPV
jgi:hypothetical protein